MPQIHGDITGRTIYTYEETSNMLVSAVNYDGVRVDLTYEGLNAYDSAAIDNYAAQVRRVVAMETRSDSIRGAKQRFRNGTSTPEKRWSLRFLGTRSRPSI